MEVFDGEHWYLSEIQNVLFVPELKINLFSVSAAMDKGYQLKVCDRVCEFTMNNRVCAVAEREDKLYKMCFKINTERANAAVNSLMMWHSKLAHQNFNQVKSILKKNEVKYEDDQTLCNACIKGKQHRLPFKDSNTRSTATCEIIHADVCGPMEVSSTGGSKYFLLLKDDYSHYRYVYFLKQKSEAKEKINTFLNLAKNITGNNVKVLRTDNGLEEVNKEEEKNLQELGICHQKTVPYCPEQNGTEEREMRTVVEAARTMLQAKNMEK